MTWMTPFDWKTSAVVTVAMPSALWWGWAQTGGGIVDAVKPACYVRGVDNYLASPSTKSLTTWQTNRAAVTS
jgi:hypothetical protein